MAADGTSSDAADSFTLETSNFEIVRFTIVVSIYGSYKTTDIRSRRLPIYAYCVLKVMIYHIHHARFIIFIIEFKLVIDSFTYFRLLPHFKFTSVT